MLEVLFRSSHEEGLTKKQARIEDIFDKTTLETWAKCSIPTGAHNSRFQPGRIPRWLSPFYLQTHRSYGSQGRIAVRICLSSETWATRGGCARHRLWSRDQIHGYRDYEVEWVAKSPVGLWRGTWNIASKADHWLSE